MPKPRGTGPENGAFLGLALGGCLYLLYPEAPSALYLGVFVVCCLGGAALDLLRSGKSDRE
jgi:hypothetical protein